MVLEQYLWSGFVGAFFFLLCWLFKGGEMLLLEMLGGIALLELCQWNSVGGKVQQVPY